MSSLYTIFLLYILVTLSGSQRLEKRLGREGRMDTEIWMLMLRRMLVMCDVYSAVQCSCILPAVVVVCLL